MATYARPVERLITELSKLPSIGPRSAQELANKKLGGITGGLGDLGLNIPGM